MCSIIAASISSAAGTVLKGGEPAGSEPDLSHPCFSEVMRIWDSVSEYMLQQFALKKVGLFLLFLLVSGCLQQPGQPPCPGVGAPWQSSEVLSEDSGAGFSWPVIISVALGQGMAFCDASFP